MFIQGDKPRRLLDTPGAVCRGLENSRALIRGTPLPWDKSHKNQDTAQAFPLPAALQAVPVRCWEWAAGSSRRSQTPLLLGVGHRQGKSPRGDLVQGYGAALSSLCPGDAAVSPLLCCAIVAWCNSLPCSQPPRGPGSCCHPSHQGAIEAQPCTGVSDPG